MPYIGKKPADIIATVIDTTTGTFSGEVDAGSLDVSGNADIDGITNLDNTDIDGTLDVSGNLTVDTNTLFVDSSNNRVGVGTVSPNANTKLDVNGAARIGNSTDGIMIENNTGSFDIDNASYIRRDSSSGALEITSGSTTARNMIFNTKTNGAESARIDSSGNVGIGTSTVTSGFKLEVTGDARFGDAYNDDAVELGWSAGGSQGFVQAYDRGASAFRNLILNNSVTINSTGNVGIGTGSPNEKLTISSGAISFLGEISTPSIGAGLFRPANNTLAVVTGSTERMRIDSSGNVGIGTSSPVATSGGLDTASSALSIVMGGNGAGGSGRTNSTNKEARLAAVHYTNSEEPVGVATVFTSSTSNDVRLGGGSSIVNAATVLSFYTANTNITTGGSERMRIDSSGNVGIGTSSIDNLLHLSGGSGTTTIKFTRSNTASTGNDFGRLKFENSAGTTLASIAAFSESGNTQAGLKFNTGTDSSTVLIDENGNLLLRSAATNRIELGNDGTSGTNSCNFIRGNNDTIDLNTGGGNYTFEVNGAVKVQFDTNGTVRNSTGTYTTISDQTLKENIVDANSQWDDIKALRIRNYNLIGDDTTQLGVIAQELETAGMNGLVEDIVWDGAEVKSVKQSIIYMKAVKALQEAITRIETLETANTALEARIVALENA